MQIRKSNYNDIDSIMNIINMAKSYLKSQNIDQWQNGYPNPDVISSDILLKNSYVLQFNDDIIATFFISFDEEPTYSVIDGEWLSNNKYCVIHRIAVKDKYKGSGVAKYILDFCTKKAIKNNIYSIKIDTHIKNLSMRKFLFKNGFCECGIITLLDGDKRVAYEKLI